MSTSDKPPTGSVLDRYIRDRPKAAEPDQPIKHSCFTEMPIAVAMLDLHLADGSRLALPYHYLEAIDFTLSPASEIKLTFPTKSVQIKGHNLHPLYTALIGHRVGRIDAAANQQFGKTESSAVTNITVTEKSRTSS